MLASGQYPGEFTEQFLRQPYFDVADCYRPSANREPLPYRRVPLTERYQRDAESTDSSTCDVFLPDADGRVCWSHYRRHVRQPRRFNQLDNVLHRLQL